MSECAKLLNRAINGARLVQVVLVKKDVKVDAEPIQAGFDFTEHQVNAHRAEDFLLLIPGQVCK